MPGLHCVSFVNLIPTVVLLKDKEELLILNSLVNLCQYVTRNFCYMNIIFKCRSQKIKYVFIDLSIEIAGYERYNTEGIRK